MKRLLVGVAGTPALKSKIECAVDLARAHGAEISVLSVVDVERISYVGAVPLGAGRYAQDLRDSRAERSHRLDEDAIGTFEEACKSAGVPVRTIREEGRPLEVLTNVWRYHDLCLLSARGWFDYGVLPEPQNDLLKLIASGVRPLLTVTEEPRPFRRALVAYNGSFESAKAMKQFLQMALWPQMELHIACVGKPKSEEAPKELLENAEGYCRLYGHTPVGVHLEGDIQGALLTHAEKVDADVLVLGSSYRKILLMKRFGKNALALLKDSKVPLFLSH